MPEDDLRRGKYLGFVAHEIKNPLATALWSCDLLKRMEAADRSGERADKMIDVSLRALRRMRRLIDDYFTIERLLESGYELKREPLALDALVQDAVQALSEKGGLDTAGWNVELPAATLSGDAEMLGRALRALLEHMSRPSGTEPARLRLTGASTPQGCVLDIHAAKPPEPVMPPAPEERPSGDPLGAVLGFSLAQHILDAHRATIQEREGGLSIAFIR